MWIKNANDKMQIKKNRKKIPYDVDQKTRNRNNFKMTPSTKQKHKTQTLSQSKLFLNKMWIIKCG